MPLHINAEEIEKEDPQVKALKKTVRTVAKQYASRYGWCDVVDSALKEAGVTADEPKMSVQVSAAIKVDCVIEVNPEELVGLSEEEMNAYVAKQIAAIKPFITVTGSSNAAEIRQPDGVRGTLDLTEDHITVVDLNEWEDPALEEQRRVMAELTSKLGVEEIPDNLELMFTSNEGRVLHLFRRGEASRYGIRSAICGADAYAPSIRSSRSENRLCARCKERAGL